MRAFLHLLFYTLPIGLAIGLTTTPFKADEAEKWGDLSFNLAYLPPHTFSLSSFSVPSNSSKLFFLDFPAVLS